MLLKMMKSQIIAVDFDGTCVIHKYPEIGAKLHGCVKVLKALQEAGHKVFLYTMRSYPVKPGDRNTLQEAVDWFTAQGFTLDGINRSPAQFSGSPKQYAAVYIDDAALGCPLAQYGDEVAVDWFRVAENLVDAGLLTENPLTAGEEVGW